MNDELEAQKEKKNILIPKFAVRYSAYQGFTIDKINLVKLAYGGKVLGSS